MERNLKIMDLPENERPRERLLKYGPEALNNGELLAIILRCGTKKENVISLSNRLIAERKGLNGLLNLESSDVMRLDGIGKAKAAELIALGELAKRFKSCRDGEKYSVKSPKDAAEYVMKDMSVLNQEHLRVILLNTKNVILEYKDVFIGSLNSSIVHPREVFSYAVSKKCAAIIICHNHPSGDPTPSGEDINVTLRLKECSKLLGIDLLDHLVIGDGVYVSLKEKGIL